MEFAGRDARVTRGRKQAPRLLEQVRDRLRVKHYSLRTEQAYVGWIRRFILANGKRHPREMGGGEVEAFLTRLATHGEVAAGTQNQALAALLFLYREVLGQKLPWMDNVVRAKRPRRLPVVLTREEVRCLLAQMQGRDWLMAGLLYGTGMRLMECLRLRVKDVDFTRRDIIVREGKGNKDRHVPLPQALETALQDQMASARLLHRTDSVAGFGAAWLPHALARKYPNAAREWGWQYVFPHRNDRSTRVPAWNAGIIWMKRSCSARSTAPASLPPSTSRRPATRCATLSPRTCWKRATTSARFRNYSATRTWPPRRSTRTC